MQTYTAHQAGLEPGAPAARGSSPAAASSPLAAFFAGLGNCTARALIESGLDDPAGPPHLNVDRAGARGGNKVAR